VIIEDVRADYHRNGSGGEGSFIAFFRVTADGIGEAVPFMATVWGFHYNEETETETYRECMVVKLQDVASVAVGYLDGETPEYIDIDAWRSTDYFLPSIMQPICEAFREGSKAKMAKYTRKPVTA
jgi:hypothetical protein